MRDLDDLMHCDTHHEGEHLDAERLSADPRFPDLDLFDEMSGVYGLALTFDLWGQALPIWRAHYQNPEPFGAEHLDAERLSADPRFPDLDLFDEMSGVYGLALTFDLWGQALPIWRVHYQNPEPFAQSDLNALGDAA